MLFTLLTFSCLFFGLSVSQKNAKVCYGKSFKLPYHFTPPLNKGPLVFTPSAGGPSKILMDNGKSQDPRLDVEFFSVFLRDIREDDEGSFSISSEEKRLANVITLKVVDCAEEMTRNYLDFLSYEFPSQADVLEFTPIYNRKQTIILWDRKNPEINGNGRGWIKNNFWTYPELTQKDNGYYNFRGKRNLLVARILLIVKEHTKNVTVDEDEHFEIVYPWLARMKTMTFTPDGGEGPTTTMRDGELVQDYWFDNRIQAVVNGIEVFRVEGKYTGTFHFKDAEDNLIMSVHLYVNDGFIIKTIQYLSIGLLFPAMILLYCCTYFGKKHYKKYHCAPETVAVTAAETSEPPAAPVLYYHGWNKAAGAAAPPSSTFSYQPVKVPEEPAVASSDPPVDEPVNVYVAPTQPEVCQPVNVPTQPQVYQPVNIDVTHPEVTPSGGWKSAPVPPISSDNLSSDAEPMFKLEGVMFPSAPPLSADSTLCDVYSSDKFNFL